MRRPKMRHGSKTLLMRLVVMIGLVVMSTAGAGASDGSLNLDLDKCVQMALEVNVSVLKAEFGDRFRIRPGPVGRCHFETFEV
jgi:hypothetical protein